MKTLGRTIKLSIISVSMFLLVALVLPKGSAISLVVADSAAIEEIEVEAGYNSAKVALDTTKPVSEITAPAGGWSFRNHVIPVLTRLGCNSGACHGAAAGKAG